MAKLSRLVSIGRLSPIPIQLDLKVLVVQGVLGPLDMKRGGCAASELQRLEEFYPGYENSYRIVVVEPRQQISDRFLCFRAIPQMFLEQTSDSSLGALAISRNELLTSGNTFHVSHALFLLFLAKNITACERVEYWQTLTLLWTK